MPQHRHIAWALIAALSASIAIVSGSALASGPVPDPFVETVADPDEVCTPGHLPTDWQDDFHPPNTVRVLRSKGPNANRVEIVDFWKYVGVVLRAEYSSGKDKPGAWMRMGALTVKQYAWYKSMFWGGGRVTYTNDHGQTIVSCFDLKDTTADQIYKPEKPDPNNPGQWIPANVPTGPNLKAMRETWHITLRKWMTDKLKSRLFLSGYRSGKQKPCGTDSTGFKVYQKSLRDCGVKGLTFEETTRRYFEDRLEIVDVRDHDMVSDNGDWRGDLGVLDAAGTWRTFKAVGNGFQPGGNGTFSGLGTLLGQGVGETTGASTDANPETPRSGEPRLFADLLMLVNEGGKKIKVARSNGSGFESPVATAAPAESEKLVVGDFNGDRMADAGLLVSTSATEAKLMVMLSQGNDAFGAASEWWSGPLSLAANGLFVAAGDVNGDGKADLVMRDTDGAYRVAASPASCGSFAAWGPCTAVGGNRLGDAVSWLDTPTWALAAGRSTLGDYDRDGRHDVLVVKAAGGSDVEVVALRARSGGGFDAPFRLWSGAGSVGATVPVGMHLDADGLGDLALLVQDGSGTDLVWLRAVAKSSNDPSTARMTSAGPAFDASTSWSAARPF